MSIFNLNFNRLSEKRQVAAAKQDGFLILELLIAVAIFIQAMVIYSIWSGKLQVFKAQIVTDLINLQHMRNIAWYRIHDNNLFEKYVHELQLKKNVNYEPINRVKTDGMSIFTYPNGIHELTVTIYDPKETHHDKQVSCACIM